MTLDQLKERISEINDLIASGDVDLGERRQKFKELEKTETYLTDAELVEAIALTDDDDDDQFADAVHFIQDNGPPTKTGKMPDEEVTAE